MFECINGHKWESIDVMNSENSKSMLYECVSYRQCKRCHKKIAVRKFTVDFEMQQPNVSVSK